MARFSGLSGGTVPASTNVLVSTTLPKLQKSVVDNFFTATPFFFWFREKNRVSTWDRGDTLEIPIMYDEAPGAKSYLTYETLDVKPPQGITTSIWTLSKYRIPIMYSRSMANANRGESAVVNLIATLKDQAQMSLVRAVNSDLFADIATSAQSTQDINSLYHLIEEYSAATMTSKAGGISKATYTWWRHQYTSVGSVKAAANYGIKEAIRELYMNCSNGSDTPDLALCDDYTYINLEDKLQTAVRFVNPRAVDWGFENVTYKGMTIMYDKSIGDDGHDADGDGTLWLLNTKYLQLWVGADANFRIVPPEWDFKQDCYLGGILVDLQVTCSNMARQGILQGGAWKSAC